MPHSPPAVCACPTLPCTGICKQRKVLQFKQYNDDRGTSTERGYDVAWRRFVKAFRAGYDLDPEDPNSAFQILARNSCVVCKSTRLLEYDHIKPLSEGGARLDPANVQALCKRHHNAKTWRERKSF